MALTSVSTSSSSGLIHYTPLKLPLPIQRPSATKLIVFNATPAQSANALRTQIRCSGSKHFGAKFAVSAGAGGHQNQFRVEGGDFPKQSFLMSLVKEIFWRLKLVIGFLREQPSQLKYIEWPSFQSTLKTAILTLVIVALLIVALASVDSVLSFLLALILRRSS